MPLQWRPQLSVANDLIDSDHQYLIEIINKAEGCLMSKRGSELHLVLDALAHYGQSHFDREELVAKAVGFPGVAQLHASHAQLLQKLQDFKNSLADSWTDESATEFTHFLRDWLVNHVIKEDMPMKPFLMKRSPRFDPR